MKTSMDKQLLPHIHNIPSVSHTTQLSWVIWKSREKWKEEQFEHKTEHSVVLQTKPTKLNLKENTKHIFTAPKTPANSHQTSHPMVQALNPHKRIKQKRHRPFKPFSREPSLLPSLHRDHHQPAAASPASPTLLPAVPVNQAIAMPFSSRPGPLQLPTVVLHVSSSNVVLSCDPHTCLDEERKWNEGSWEERNWVKRNRVEKNRVDLYFL